jgi:DNA-directed DNA polymerase III PolC
LHVHSHFSLLGATASPSELVARAQRDGLSQLALTDSNGLHGAVGFARACTAAGIRPIIGMTASLALPAEDMRPDRHAGWGRLVLLAAEPEGYRSLCRLSSLYWADPDLERRQRAGLGWAELREHTRGLICLTGGRTCWLERLLRAGNLTAATRYVARLGGLFDERCVLSISPDLMTSSLRPLADEIMALGARFGLRAAAIQPIFCLEEAQRPRLRLLAVIDANRPLADAGREPVVGTLPDYGEEQTTVAWPAPDDFARRYEVCPGLLRAAGEVADECGEVLPDGRLLWPVLAGTAGQLPAEALRQAAETGLAERYSADAPPTAAGRLAREIAAIGDYGYAPLFLLVADVVRFARSAGIPVSTRGSVANSLLAYCLGITSVDPVAHDLLFERFLSPARRSPPDIDLDFCSRRRDEVLDYIRRTYGDDRVALVSTMNTFRPRSAVRETGKAYGLSDEAIDHLVDLLPEGWHPDPRRRSHEGVEDVLAKLDDPIHREVIREAYGLVGLPHHAGLHPGGVVITPGPLTDTVPVLLSAKGFLATQYEHADVEAIGLPKLDLLGIRALTVLADAAELVRRRHATGFQLDAIPADDPATGDLLAEAETIGVFQCESAGARRTLRQLAARNVADLAIAGAFFKPGPAMGGMARSFIRRYRDQEPVTYLHPALEPILSRTKGVLLFQEQVLRLAREIAGLSWEQADGLRRGMSRFREHEMTALAAAFTDGCRRPAPGPGMTREQATRLWEQVIAFAGYGFNQGHATAYADVSYRSAYIKAHWPAEFLCARLADAGGFHHPAIYMAEAARLGISVQPPHVNHSESRFALSYEGEQPVLWMGLGQVRDLRAASVRAIVAGRLAAPYNSLGDLLARAPLQSKESVHLIRCGALDGLGASRAAMLDEVSRAGRAGSAHQMSFAFADADPPPAETPAQRVAWEAELLGQPVSVHPLALVAPLPDATPLRRLPDIPGRPVTVSAVRVPGWPGGPGFFIGDGETFVIARLDKQLAAERVRRPVWRPLRLAGRWLRDEWGNGWFQVEAIEPIRY